MATDDDGDDEVGSGPPLPPDDRLWRHPSELRQHGVPSGIGAAVAARRNRPATMALMLVAGLVGAVLTTGVIAVTGSLSPRVVEREIVEKVALTPVVSSPMLRGERGVASLAERLSTAVVRIDAEGTRGAVTGSGVLFRDDGLVLTSAFVVAESTTISVVLSDGRRLPAQLLGLDLATDVALIDLAGQKFPVAVLGSSSRLEAGEPIVTVASPLGSDGGPLVTSGVISGLDRRIAGAGGNPLHGMIQTDAPVGPGSSGAPLIDATGAVIGIMAAAGSDAGQFGFATPIDLAHRVADQLLATGHMAHGWLGVEAADLTAPQAQAMNIAGGTRVERVATGSPAAAAGLMADDVITEVNGAPIRSVSNLVMQLRARNPGDRVIIGYWRNAAHADVAVRLVERP